MGDDDNDDEDHDDDHDDDDDDDDDHNREMRIMMTTIGLIDDVREKDVTFVLSSANMTSPLLYPKHNTMRMLPLCNQS